MNLQKTEEALQNALALIQKLTVEVESLQREVEAAKAQRDPLAVHIFKSRARYRSVSDTDNKGGKRTEFEVRESYIRAQALGYRGSGSDWWELMRAWKSERSSA